LRVPVMYSRNILQQAKGDHLDQVHSDQIVLEMIRWGRLVSRAVAQQRPRVSKLGLKGLSDYFSYIYPRRPTGGPVGQVKGLLS
jgi:hypothetical protein